MHRDGSPLLLLSLCAAAASVAGAGAPPPRCCFVPIASNNSPSPSRCDRRNGADCGRGHIIINGRRHRDRSRRLLATASTRTDRNARGHGARCNARDNDQCELEGILRKHGFGRRIVTLTNDGLAGDPVRAELCEGGSWTPCVVLGLRPPNGMTGGAMPKKKRKEHDDDAQPLLDVLTVLDDAGGDGCQELQFRRRAVDVGQITTLWHDVRPPTTSRAIAAAGDGDQLEAMAEGVRSTLRAARASLRDDILPVEDAMEGLYNGRMADRSRRRPATPPRSGNGSYGGKRSLSKKDVSRVASGTSNPIRAEELLRGMLKVGEDRSSRLVDSAMAADYLFSDYSRRDGDGGAAATVRRTVGAAVLSEDAASGGRFKRRPCQFVSARYADGSDGAAQRVESVTLMNGGWMAVDPSVKAGTEGRKFARGANEKNGDGEDGEALVLTAADERIARRLECLAMGDALERSDSDRQGDGTERMLELDVREALTAMNLPLSPLGAQSALVKLGRWSEKAGGHGENAKNNLLVDPWSPDLLAASRSLAQHEDTRRTSLAEKCFGTKKGAAAANKKTKMKPSLKDGLEGRVNLSSLPCVCIDARRASFRDDSIGVRLRSSTGRKVNKSASKWEVLVHIADVSDIYFDRRSDDVVAPTESDVNLRLLREAAERRGQSRYDLPLGPLHLLPPMALTAISLSVNEQTTINRCVTLWAYIDERDGKLLEAGLERTIISSPKALTFSDATNLLESNAEQVPKSMANSKAILSVAERNLSLWNKRHRQLNQAAQKKEERFRAKELISKELNAASKTQRRDDGDDDSFQRTRGHRVVDASLDLYAFAVGTLMKRANQPIPRAAGSGADRGGRLGTAPLRRYIDGVAQRQALAVLCGYGRKMTKKECIDATKLAAYARDNIDNIRSTKQLQTAVGSLGNQRQQVSALHKLARHLASTGGIGNRQQVKALSTGHNNEVVILGAGAKAKCKGVKGTLKPGEQLLVQVVKIDPEIGLLDVSLVRT